MKRKKVSVHTPGMPMRLFVLLMGLFAAGIHAFIFRSMTGEGIAIPMLLISIALIFDAVMVWWAVIFMTQSRVTLFEEGIELERGGAKVFTTWDNVSHLGIRGGGKNSRRGMFLHDKVTPDTKGLIEKLFFGWKTGFIPIGQYVHLPKIWNPFSREINTEKLLDSEFGQELYDLAPHLFEEYDEWKPKNRLEDDYADEYESDWVENMSSKQKARK